MPVLEAPIQAHTVPTYGAKEHRIIDAALRCIARWGVAKTTLDDVAREAGYSRATVYRFFPGGKDGLIDSVVRAEVARVFAVVGDRLDAATDLEDAVVGGMTTAARLVAEHRALQYVVTNEPEVLLPKISFHQADAVLGFVSAFAAPYLARWLPETVDAHRAAEWITRIVLSYACSPSPAVDLSSDESVRNLVRTFVLPGLATTP